MCIYVSNCYTSDGTGLQRHYRLKLDRTILMKCMAWFFKIIAAQNDTNSGLQPFGTGASTKESLLLCMKS